MLFSTAYAQAAGATAGGGFGGLEQLFLIVPIIAVFYFFMIRPQQKKVKDHRALIAGVRRGDRVVTGGGLIGLVTKVISDGEVQIEIAEGVRVRVVRNTITEVLSKTAAADSKSDDAASSDKDKKDR